MLRRRRRRRRRGKRKCAVGPVPGRIRTIKPLLPAEHGDSTQSQRSCSDRVKLWREVTNICIFGDSRSALPPPVHWPGQLVPESNELWDLHSALGKRVALRPFVPLFPSGWYGMLLSFHSSLPLSACERLWMGPVHYWWQKCCRSGVHQSNKPNRPAQVIIQLFGVFHISHPSVPLLSPG